MMTTPLVSVLMPAYNAEAYIAESIESVLAQTMGDFELVVVDDGSTDRTREIVLSYPDSRVHLVVNERNLGVVAACNRTFAEAHGRYAAVLDSDDVMFPERLARQSAYLDNNPSTVMVASAGVVLQDGQLARTTSDESEPVVIAWLMHLVNELGHSSVMFRKDAVESLGEYLRPECQYIEDFDFTHRLLRIGTVSRIPEVLVKFRSHSDSVSRTRQAEIMKVGTQILERLYAPMIGSAAREAAPLIMRHTMSGLPMCAPGEFVRLAEVLTALFGAFERQHALTQEQRRRIRAKTVDIWMRAVITSARTGHVVATLRGFSAFQWYRPSLRSLFFLARASLRGIIRPVAW
jgi:glycosyltransferase involved in cell wall biosynthesis